VNSVWDVVYDQKPFKKGLCRVGIPTGLQEDVQHRSEFVDCPPQPVFPATDLDAHLIQEPSGTPPGFPMAQLLSEQRCELDVPLAEGLVTDNNATLVQQFLDITLTEGKPVVEPEGVLDDAQGKRWR